MNGSRRTQLSSMQQTPVQGLLAPSLLQIGLQGASDHVSWSTGLASDHSAPYASGWSSTFCFPLIWQRVVVHRAC